jgi:ribosomal protein S18 acetylase RimI-like enzyme
MLARNDDPGVRPLTKEDEPHLWEFLYYAIFVPQDARAPERDVIQQPELARDVTSWGRAHDFGFVAFFKKDSDPAGAAWCRHFSDYEKGYGYIDAVTPELSIAVRPNKRNLGVGTILLTCLLETARSKYQAISLSVSAENPARRLYKRFGFVEIEKRGNSIAMRLDLSLKQDQH